MGGIFPIMEYIKIIIKISLVSLIFINTAFSDDYQCEAEKGYLDRVSKEILSKENAASDLCFVTSFDPSALAVDIRDPNEYQAMHIDGSINVATHSIKAKSFLKNRKILIFPDGFERSKSSELCSELISNGFQNPQILLDSLNNISVINKLKNNYPSIKKMRFVKPELVLQELQQANLVLVAQSQVILTELAGFQKTIPLLNGKDESDQLKQLERISLSRSRNRLLPVVLVGDATLYQSLSRFKLSQNLSNLYFLDGDAGDLKNLWDKKKMMKIKKSKIPERYKCSNV